MNIENESNMTKLIALSADNSEYEFSVRNNYEYTYNNRKVRIELIEEADGFIILSCEGTRYPVEIISQKQNTYEVLINGVSYHFSVETPFSLQRKRLLATQNGASKTEIVRAPMPGKILDVTVEAGALVNKGEALFVLEAMKMQNTLTSPIKGIVSKVSVKVDDSVGKDEVLLEIKAE